MESTPALLGQLNAEGQSQEAIELREELLDRPPNRWYQCGFLSPSETSLGDRLDDAADAEFTIQGYLQATGAITGRRKLPWRYRWPDAVRDDVLARLLALNAERDAEEVAMGLHSKEAKQAAKAAKAGSTPGGKRRGRPPKASQVGETGPTHTEQMGLGL
jgi:hypothetical protein